MSRDYRQALSAFERRDLQNFLNFFSNDVEFQYPISTAVWLEKLAETLIFAGSHLGSPKQPCEASQFHSRPDLSHILKRTSEGEIGT
jgi:hypothetical protein